MIRLEAVSHDRPLFRQGKAHPRMRTIHRCLIVALTVVVVATVANLGQFTPSYAESDAASGGTTYVVRRGDTLYAIAKKFGVSAAAIARANRLRDPSKIYTGMRLFIPGAKPAPAPTPRYKPTPPPPPPSPATIEPSLIPTTRPQ